MNPPNKTITIFFLTNIETCDYTQYTDDFLNIIETIYYGNTAAININKF